MAPIGMQPTPLSSFCSYWKGRTPKLAVRNALSSAFPDLATLPLPIDVAGLAKRRGIREIIYTELQSDGQISRSPSGDYVVYLHSAQPEPRRRFTLAHEIAHTFFFEARQFGLQRYMGDGALPSRDPEEERLCDFAATEILMPAARVSSLIRRQGYSANTLLHATQKFRSSLRSTARRLGEVGRFKLLVHFWEQDVSTGTFLSIWHEGIGARARAEGEPSVVTADQPAHKTFSSAEKFRGRYWLSLGGPLEHYFVDGLLLSAKPRRILTITILDRLAELLPGERVEEVPQQTLF